MAEGNGKAAEMFAAGESVNAVARALGIAWAAAKKLQGGATGEAAPKRRQRAAGPEAEAEDSDVPESFDLSVTVGTGSLGRLFATFTAQEQANAVLGVIQQRMDALLEG